MEKHKEFETSFNSRLSDVKNISASISAFLSDTLKNISAEDKSELKLIFSELLCNAVIHGNKNNTEKNVYVHIDILGDDVHSVIKDEGNGFDYLSLLDKKTTNSNLYDDHGRGIWLVYSLSDSLSFNNKGNEIKFYKKVGLQ